MESYGGWMMGEGNQPVDESASDVNGRAAASRQPGVCCLCLLAVGVGRWQGGRDRGGGGMTVIFQR